MALSIVFVLPYGEPSDGFFPDTLLALLAGQARDVGHDSRLVRVYYHGRNAETDRSIAERLEAFLTEHRADVVVVERLFDSAPIERYLSKYAGTIAVLVSRGDSFEPTPGIRYVVGKTPGQTRRGDTRRTPTTGELAKSFARLLQALENGTDPVLVPGVAEIDWTGNWRVGPPPEPAEPVRPFSFLLAQDVIAPGAAPIVRRKTLLGNAGCPFSLDPLENPHYTGIQPPETMSLSRLGCAFCSMGGDYQKRADEVVISELVEQALALTKNDESITELVSSDQYALRYLSRLVRACANAGVRPMRFLFAARVDSFVKEIKRVEEAIAAAEETGHSIEVYLSGFEAFCNRELLRYNKGTTVAEQVQAVNEMRRLRRKHPRTFYYERARGHSLILWNPWTGPEDLRESVENVRENGFGELFHELGKNRLRLYKDLPIYWAAERDGAVRDAWEEGDQGAGKRKGYNVEIPWRFLNERTRLAYDLSREIRELLGAETEVAQLLATIEYCERTGLENASADKTSILAQVAQLQEKLAPRGQSDKANVVLFAGACNNGCAACPNRDEWRADDEAALFERVDEARQINGPIVLAGREPTMHPAFLRILARARGAERRPVGIVSNGRRFAYPKFAQASVFAGLTAASIKIFAPEQIAADRISRDPGGFSQACAAFAVLRKLGISALELRAPLNRENMHHYALFARLARNLGADALRVECALDALGLENLKAGMDAVDSLVDVCQQFDLSLAISPLRAGSKVFDRLPFPRRGRL